jgi:Flp pilus assembly pilin Flp
MKTKLHRFLADESGAMFVEYSLLVILIGVLLISMISRLGTGVANRYGSIASNLS